MMQVQLTRKGLESLEDDSEQGTRSEASVRHEPGKKEPCGSDDDVSQLPRTARSLVALREYHSRFKEKR